MGRWPTGVSIVTSRDGEEIHGMTVSDFSGVSLSPPLVLVCASHDSITRGVIAASRCFAVNVLAANQRELSNRFASKKDEHRRFEGVAFGEGVTGAPLLDDAAAIFDCRLHATFEAGDHDIYVGAVESVRLRDCEPLVYFGGSYDRLASHTISEA
jgi:flavin reductase (DIM6/NTAB) family NADH-FMN oxidoreductase RutF